MIMNPTAIKHVVVDGHSLTLESFVAIARYNATVELAPSALEAMQKSRALAEKIAAEGRVAYGITTGFGEFQKVAVPKEMSNQLSTNLILSHCTAAGEPYADEIVRGMMLLPVLYASSISTKRYSLEFHRMISSEKRLRCIIMVENALKSSIT